MLTNTQVIALHQALHDRQVLSVYIDGAATDPALQRAWRLNLEHALDALASRLADAGAAERAEFVQCRRTLETSLLDFDLPLRTPGWAGFITPDGIATALPLPVRTPTIAMWGKGAALSPYLRAERTSRDVVVAIADARHTTLYRYRAGALQRVERIRSHHPLEHAEHMGAPARGGFHTGTRGRTAREAAQRALRRGRDRMLTEAATRIVKLAETDGWIVIAGTELVMGRLIERLNGVAPGRVTRSHDIHLHSTEAEIAEGAAKAAVTLASAAALRRLADIAEAAGAHALGVMGRDDTMRALKAACVRALLVTPRYSTLHSGEADQAIRLAFDQNATVEEVDGPAAALLDERGGIAGALRFRPHSLVTQSTVAAIAHVRLI